jgi:hypothetical protein
LVQALGYDIFGVYSERSAEQIDAHTIHLDRLPQHEKEISEALARAELVVCHLEAGPEASIWLLRKTAAEASASKTLTTFIAISSPLVWACTDVHALKRKCDATVDATLEETALEDQHGHDDMGDHDGEATRDAVAPDGAANPDPKPIGGGAADATPSLQSTCAATAQLEADDASHRQPTPEAAHIFRAENIIIFRHQPGKLHTYIVCPGVLYGNGECDGGFHKHFSRAWQASEDTALPVYGSGSNRIPTVHVSDLCAYVALVKNTLPQTRYLFVTDNSRCTQLELVQAISQNLGSGHLMKGEDVALYTQQVF